MQAAKIIGQTEEKLFFSFNIYQTYSNRLLQKVKIALSSFLDHNIISVTINSSASACKKSRVQ